MNILLNPQEKSMKIHYSYIFQRPFQLLAFVFHTLSFFKRENL